MRHLPALLVLMIATAGQVRADYLNWTYSADANVKTVSVNTPSNGGATVSFAAYNAPQPGGTNVPIEGYVTTTSSTTPISFNNSPFDLALKITDSATHDSGTLNFTGSLSGSMTATTSSVVASFAPVSSRSLILDGHTYTVSIPSVTLAPPTSAQKDIMASISVMNASPPPGGGGGTPPPPPPPPPTSSTPEPTSLVLSILGMSCYGTVRWWKYQRLPRALEAA
jgi:hypothetical protein